MNLKPCPHCGGHHAKLFARSWTVKKHFFVVCVKEKCHCCGPQAESPEAAAEAWNNLPRALVWTSEPPKVPGWYWRKNEKYSSLDVVEVYKFVNNIHYFLPGCESEYEVKQGDEWAAAAWRG